MKLGPIDFTWSDIWDLIKIIPLFRTKYSRENIHILFVDDEYEDFTVIQNLKDSKWFVTAVSDIENEDDVNVKNSQIVFIDYKGVGKIFSTNEQGIALIRLIKKVYKEKKRVILYSGHDKFTLGDKFNVADDWLPKNSDTREFIEKIYENMEKLR